MTNRQEKTTEKHQVMVNVPMDLYLFLKDRADQSGLSLSAFVVWLIRQERRGAHQDMHIVVPRQNGNSNDNIT